MRFLRAIWTWYKENHFVLDLVFWLILISLILKEMKTGNETVELMRKNLDTATTQAKRLDDALTTLGETNAKIKDSMENQLAILADEQRRHLADMARKPKLELTVGGIPVVGKPLRQVPNGELTASHAIWEVRLTNNGTASAHTGFLRIWADKEAVQLYCSICSTERDPLVARKDRVTFVPIQQLPPRTWLLIQLNAAYPPNVREFTVNFNVQAEDYPNMRLGSIKVEPPAQP